MKIEYLLIKTNNDFCSTPDQLKSLLLSNKRISMDESHIKFSDASFAYSLTSQEVEWKKNKEIVFYLTVSTENNENGDENVQRIEDFDGLLRRIKDECGNQFKINTIWDDVSIYYTNKLYPEMVVVENLLRKLIYRFMIKTAGSAWFGDTVPAGFREAIAKTAEKNKLEELPTEDQLYLADFIQLGWFFFEKYTTKPFGQDVIRELKSAVNEDDLKSKVEALVETYEAKSNWDRYFAVKIEVENLYDKWQKLYGYRNRVAHAKRINGLDYKQAVALISELKSAFEKCLDHIDDVEMSEEEAEAVQEVAKETIRPKKTAVDLGSWSARYPGVITGLSETGLAASKLSSQVNLGGLSSGVLQMVDQQQRLSDRINLVGTSSILADSLMPQVRLASETGELLLRMTEPYQHTLDAVRISTEPLTAVPNYLRSLGLDSSGTIKASELANVGISAKGEAQSSKSTVRDNPEGMNIAEDKSEGETQQ